MRKKSYISAGAIALAIAGMFGWGAQRAEAIPVLQLWVEGATYVGEKNTTGGDQGETWVFNVDVDAGQTLKIWTIGNINGMGGMGDIFDVHLSIAYDASLYGEIGFLLAPTTASAQYASFGDMSTPQQDVFAGEFEIDGNAPDATAVHSPHSVYKNPVAWQEFNLGDFDTPDSRLVDFQTNFAMPSMSDPLVAQINVYEIQVLSNVLMGQSIELHFDLHGFLDAAEGQPGADFVFAPYSHDSGGSTEIIPSPSGVVVGLVGMGMLAIRRGRRRGAEEVEEVEQPAEV